MESMTKNKQSPDRIGAMIGKAFPGLTAACITELKEGFFNAAYLIELSDGREVVLKIAPPKDAIIMTHEKNIMFSEVASMQLVARRTDVPAASILFYDNSQTISDTDYFFMKKLAGRSYHSLMGELGDSEKASIDTQVGRFNREIHTIAGERFGYFGQPDKQGAVWYDVFKSIAMDAISDAHAMQIDLQLDMERLMERMDADRRHFAEVTVPRLVHWDLWAGNVFVEDGTVTGLIDFERCLWADPLMEVGFRTFAQSSHFLSGYGINEWSESQLARIRWYDIYLFLISALECDYRQYDTRDAYNWAVHMLRETMKALAGDEDSSLTM